MLVVLTMRRVERQPSDDSPVDGVRMLALLPRQWHKEFKQAAGYIAIRIRADEETSTAQIRAQVVAILTNPEVSRWRLVSFETLTSSHQGPRKALSVNARHIRQRAPWN
jgi:hypothetical protein